MRAVLTSFGSTGDFEPMLALAIEMKRHGHEAVLAFLPQYVERAAKFQIEFAPTGPASLFEELQNSIRTELKGEALDGEQFDCYSPSAMMRLFADLRRATSKADVLICSAEWPFGRMIHELTGIPFVSIHLDRFNEEYARESSTQIAAWEQQLAAVINPFRARLGLRPLEHPLTSDGNSPQLALFAVSRMLLDPVREPGWPDHHHVTGFLFVEESWEPDEELEEFVEGGEPPVVFTFGSMAYDSGDDLGEIVLETVRRLDCKVILQHGWGDMFHGRELPAKVKAVEFVPYGWLFPRASCVVQAGGAGTTAWALKSGVPTVCIPQLWQQFTYARFAEKQGCGKVVKRGELSAARLSEAVREVLSDERYAKRAREAGRRISEEGGARQARLLIERWYREPGGEARPAA